MPQRQEQFAHGYATTFYAAQCTKSQALHAFKTIRREKNGYFERKKKCAGINIIKSCQRHSRALSQCSPYKAFNFRSLFFSPPLVYRISRVQECIASNERCRYRILTRKYVFSRHSLLCVNIEIPRVAICKNSSLAGKGQRHRVEAVKRLTAQSLLEFLALRYMRNRESFGGCEGGAAAKQQRNDEKEGKKRASKVRRSSISIAELTQNERRGDGAAEKNFVGYDRKAIWLFYFRSIILTASHEMAHLSSLGKRSKQLFSGALSCARYFDFVSS